jgi:hypothetical protein
LLPYVLGVPSVEPVDAELGGDAAAPIELELLEVLDPKVELVPLLKLVLLL